VNNQITQPDFTPLREFRRQIYDALASRRPKFARNSASSLASLRAGA